MSVIAQLRLVSNQSIQVTFDACYGLKRIPSGPYPLFEFGVCRHHFSSPAWYPTRMSTIGRPAAANVLTTGGDCNRSNKCAQREQHSGFSQTFRIRPTSRALTPISYSRTLVDLKVEVEHDHARPETGEWVKRLHRDVRR